jgi:hypothetical protein
MVSIDIRNKVKILIISTIVIAITMTTAVALPEVLNNFNVHYNTIGTRLDTCDTCHYPGSQNATNLNPYGIDVKNNLNMPMDKAFASIEHLDSDMDGFSNIDEIHNLTFPGNKSDFPGMSAVVGTTNIINRTDDNVTIVHTTGENNVVMATTTIVPTTIATISKTTTEKVPGFGILASIISVIFIFRIYRNRKK